MNKNITLATTTAITAILTLSSCSTEKETFDRIPFCKNIVENVIGKKLAWSGSEENEAGLVMQVSVTSEEHVASCIYDSKDRNEGGGGDFDTDDYERSPTSVIINGNELSAAELIKATAQVTGQASKKAAKEVAEKSAEAAEKAKEMAAEAADKAKGVAGKAKDAAGKAIEAAKDSLSQ